MSRESRRVLGLLLALMALALTAPTTAPAHKLGSGSYLELSPVATSATTMQYSGRVNSASRFCRSRRVVQLHVGGILLATVRTDRGGNWSLSGTRPRVGAAVTAVVNRTAKKTRRHRHRCGSDTLTKKAP